MIDYRELLETIQDSKIIELMRGLGATRYIETAEYIIFPTICHNISEDEASMKLYYYKNSKLFVCYTSCGNMSIFKFLEEYYKTRNYDYNWFTDIYEVVANCSDKTFSEGFEPVTLVNLRDRFSSKRAEVHLETYPTGVLDVFTKIYPVEWLNDGISKATMDKYNIRYSISQQKIIIPHLNINGELVGIRGRALDEWEIENLGKYMPVQIEGKMYSHRLSMNLYGLYENLENIKSRGVVYLFESEKAVMQCESFSEPNCAVAVCGDKINKYQLNLLFRHCYPKEIVICFDNEEENGSDKYFNRLYELGKKYNHYCDFSFIYDRESTTKKKDSPSDRGEEVFKELVNKRVKVM